jgi:hypothetical protein
VKKVFAPTPLPYWLEFNEVYLTKFIKVKLLLQQLNSKQTQKSQGKFLGFYHIKYIEKTRTSNSPCLILSKFKFTPIAFISA